MEIGQVYIKKTNKLEFIISKFDKVDVIFHERHYPTLKIMTIRAFLEVFEEKQATEELGYWERMKSLNQENQMDNQSPLDNGINPSY